MGVSSGLRSQPGESPAEIVEELRARLVELAEGKLSHAAIDPARHLFDHGYVDSLSAVMLLAHIEERWGVEIEDTRLLDELSTLDAIARHIHARG
jgi:acyl carrier protein